MSPSALPSISADVIIVGAGKISGNSLILLFGHLGFGGCYLLHLLREKGFSVKVLEAGVGLGGIWSWNRYPGARVDCEFPYYGYSDPAIWSTWYWPERFPDHTTLRSYFDHVDDVWNLSKDVYFKTKVVAARFQDEKTPYWEIETADGQKHTCTWFVPATGTSFKQYIPGWEGLETFKGTISHSSLWPHEGVDISGKRVGVIGAGATGIQLVQDGSKLASHVTQFIRTPNTALPMVQRTISKEEIRCSRDKYGHVFKACRTTGFGLPTEGQPCGTFDVSEEERNKIWEELWARGGFNWSIGGFPDTIVTKEANLAAYNFWVKKTRARIKDPKKRDLLAPLDPPYYLGTKRPSLEQDYYESCDQDHVEITNSPISQFTETGIKTEDGKSHEFDVIAICTGYDAVTGGLRTMGIKGRGGVDLDENWKDGVSTHLGMMVNGYPNMYFIYGPQAPTSFTNGPPFLEMQGEWITDVICKQRDEKLASVEAKKDAEEAWAKGVRDLANMTLAVQTNSWYMGANVPGKKREFLLYLGGLPEWQKACQKALDGWNDFEVNHGNQQARI